MCGKRLLLTRINDHHQLHPFTTPQPSIPVPHSHLFPSAPTQLCACTRRPYLRSLSVQASPKLAKLQTAQASQRKARTAHNVVVSGALSQLERLEVEKVEVLREVMSGLMAEVGRDHSKAYQSALSVKEKVDAIDPARGVLDWVRHIESGAPCTWIVEGEETSGIAPPIDPPHTPR